VTLQLTTEIFLEAAVPPDITEADLDRLLSFGLTAEGASGAWRIELVLADDALLRRLHHEFMGLDSATDIMTFPDVDESGPEGPVSGGQIYISIERAAEQAAEFGQTVADEVRFLVLHGVLHLRGWDDDTEAKRDVMLARQADLLREFLKSPS
jgi:probable rRNA maturation factor